MLPLRTPRFPFVSLFAVALIVTTAATLASVSSRYCAFGFGGFQCIGPMSGLGGVLAVATFLSLILLPPFLLLLVWRMFRWWRWRVRAEIGAPPSESKRR